MEDSHVPAPGSATLLEVQSEQLALQLQEEADKEDGRTTQLDPTAKNIESSASGKTPPPQAPTAQGAWAIGGPTAADVLRAANATTAGTQDTGSSPSRNELVSSGDLQIAAVPLSASAVSMMVAMGIEETWAASALRRCGGSDVARAVEFCFSHDMAPLAEADARLDVTKIQDPDADMAFAMALEEETRREYEASRRQAAGVMSDAQQGTFCSKITFCSAATAAARRGALGTSSVGLTDKTAGGAAEEGRRWGADDAYDMDTLEAEAGPSSETELGSGRVGRCGADDIDGRGSSGDGAREGGVAEGGDGEVFTVLPGGGRRKGKMPLFKNADGEVVSKHDAVICGRMNAREASNNLDGVGDLTVSGVRLSNRTYNSLKKDIRKKQEKGMVAGGRVEVATRSTQEGVMDEHTRLLILKMVNADVLSEVHGMVKTGKEAHVYHAAAPEDPEDPSSGKIRDVAVKIFKTTLNEFGNRAAYVDGDPRYGSMRFNKHSRRKMFTIWAKKEDRNLIRLHRAGVPCPEPILQREHVLVMSFVGTDHWPAPQLRELDLSPTNWRRCYAQALELVRAMYQKCKLVHADLSEYNILYHKKVCHVIDVGQAVDVGHPKFRELLERDVSVISQFFRRQGVVRCLQVAMAERFVVEYGGPFEHDGASVSSARRGDDDNEDKEVDTPPTGFRVILELMETPGDEVEDALLAGCKEAATWANRSPWGDSNDHGSGSEDDEEYHQEGESLEEGLYHVEEVVDEGGDGSNGANIRANEGVEIRAGKAVKSSKDEHGDELIGQSGHLSDEGVGTENRRARTKGLSTKKERRKDKVELGYGERARTAEMKEILKAGLSLP